MFLKLKINLEKKECIAQKDAGDKLIWLEKRKDIHSLKVVLTANRFFLLGLTIFIALLNAKMKHTKKESKKLQA